MLGEYVLSDDEELVPTLSTSPLRSTTLQRDKICSLSVTATSLVSINSEYEMALGKFLQSTSGQSDETTKTLRADIKRIVREQTKKKDEARNKLNSRFPAVAQKTFSGDVKSTFSWTIVSAFGLGDGDRY